MKKQTFLTLYRHSKLKFRYDFELKKIRPEKNTVFWDPVPNLEWIDTLYVTYSTNSQQLAIRNIWL